MSKMLETVKSMSKDELASAFVRGKAAARRAREVGEEKAGQVLGAVISNASGYAVGVARHNMGKGTNKEIIVPGMNVQLTLIAPAAAQLLGIFGMFGKHTDRVLDAANGAASGHWAIEGFLHGLPGDKR